MSFRNNNFNNMNNDYPKTKIILPPHLREITKKEKIISINNIDKRKNINQEKEKERMDDFLKLFNIS